MMRSVMRRLGGWMPLFAVVGLLPVFGCETPELPSDISMDTLEDRMAQVMDPQREYRNAHSYIQRQNIEEKGLFSSKMNVVEVRFQRPDRFKVTVYDENEPQSGILSRDGRAWSIDYRNGIITELFGNELAKTRVMLALGHPDNDYDKLFRKIDMSLVTIDDDGKDLLCYKLVCSSGLPGSTPFIIYVNRALSLPKRIELEFELNGRTVHYVNNIVEYQNFGGVRVPTLSRITDGDREYTSRVVGYLLNPKFRDNEFQVPEFDPVLMEMKRQRLKRR